MTYYKINYSKYYNKSIKNLATIRLRLVKSGFDCNLVNKKYLLCSYNYSFGFRVEFNFDGFFRLEIVRHPLEMNCTFFLKDAFTLFRQIDKIISLENQFYLSYKKYDDSTLVGVYLTSTVTHSNVFIKYYHASIVDSLEIDKLKILSENYFNPKIKNFLFHTLKK